MRRVAVLAGCVLLAGCTQSTAGGAGPDRLDPETLRVTGSTPVTASGPLRLSPDGSRVLRLDELDLCVTALDGSDERCAGPGVHADPRGAQWSPDGSMIAFTEDFTRQGFDPDVWVFDLRTGKTRNLTDDGVAEASAGDIAPPSMIDMLPSWSPDGKSVRFARGTPSKLESTDLMSVSVSDGKLTTVREVRCERPALTALAWSAELMAWTCGLRNAEVVAADVAGERDEWTVLPGADEDRMLLSFSPEGRSLLVDSLESYSSVEPEGGRAKVVPVEGGTARPVAEGEVAYPAWVPGSGAVAYVELPGTLKVAPDPAGGEGSSPREVHAAGDLAGSDGTRLNWGEGSLLAFEDGRATLLKMSD
ncbi:TolB family protein [Actinophytocola sp.]|uniref:TolB family protein n=1 Tax=Actinophytocola sp. TaxID=1872138 RepID=UPI003D6C3400